MICGTVIKVTMVVRPENVMCLFFNVVDLSLVQK